MSVHAQVPDSLEKVNIDQLEPDSSLIRDSFDTLLQTEPEDRITQKNTHAPKISKDAIDEPIEYGAKDSQRVEIKHNILHLYGEAFVKSRDVVINAAYIQIDFKTKEAYAEGLKNANGDVVGQPEMEVSQKKFKYKRLRYNFDTQKGIIYDAITQEGQLYIHGGITKFVRDDSDSLVVEDHIYNRNALVTSCDLEHPHYGIRATKLKVIPDKLAVLGPARLELAGIPTPFFIPFAFFPIIKGQTNGLIFPRDYEFSAALGFGFRDVGYYFKASEYMDFRITGDIYTRGSWGLRVASNYKKRYKYSGSYNVAYSRQLTEMEGDSLPSVSNSFSISLSHTQDAKAHPYFSWGGNINFTTKDYTRRNFNDAESRLQSTVASNFSFRHSLPRVDALSLTANIGFNQNTTNRNIIFTLPDLQLRMKTIFPFKKRKSGNTEKWYEKINTSYNAKFKNYVSTFDTIIFTQETLDKLQTGFSHEARANASFNMLKYFNFNPSVSYDELWFVKTLEKEYDPDSMRVEDTFKKGFRTYRKFQTGFNISTNIFGTVQFSKGWLRGIRHVIKPSIGFTFSPATDGYYKEVQSDSLGTMIAYNPFQGGIFGSPSLSERQMSFTYSIINIFEAKYYSKRDSTEKKFKLLDNISLNGSYNFANDTLQWSQVRMSGATRFFKGLVTLSMNATFDPYLEKNNRRINVTSWSQNKKLLRFEQFSSNLSVGFSLKQIKDMFTSKKTDTNSTSNENRKNNKKKGFMQESVFDIIDNFRLSYSYNFLINSSDGINEFQLNNHSLQLKGELPITENMSIRLGNIAYDFKNKSFVYPDFGFTRDLHCWNMSFSWQPNRGTYTFFIGVKTSELSQFLKYNYGKNQFDRFY